MFRVAQATLDCKEVDLFNWMFFMIFSGLETSLLPTGKQFFPQDVYLVSIIMGFSVIIT